MENKKKAQLKIQQMAFMLLAVVLLFILVGLFYFSIQSKSLYNQANQLEQNQATLLARFLSDSAEFTCGAFCIDTDRLMVLKDRSVYDKFWPVESIKVVKTGGQEKCNKGNYPNCNIFEIYDSKAESTSSAGSFVALCRWESVEGFKIRKCELGRIVIGYKVR